MGYMNSLPTAIGEGQAGAPGTAGPPGPQGLPGPPGEGVRKRQIVNVVAGLNPAECVVVQQLNTAIAAKVDQTLLSIPAMNIAGGKNQTYNSKKALVSSGLIFNDSGNDTVEILAKAKDFSNMPLWIPNIQNFDGRAERKNPTFS